MTNFLPETQGWDPIRQIENGDPFQGGVDGLDNLPHRQLLGRVLYLRAIADTHAGLIAAKLDAALRDVANGYAGLGPDGKLASGVLPSLAIGDTFVVTSQAEMLALAAQRGDVAVRIDENKTYRLATDTPSDLASWIWVRTPADLVQSVFGRTGSIQAAKGDYVAGQVTLEGSGSFVAAGDVLAALLALDAAKSGAGHGHQIADVGGLQVALDGKSPVGHGHQITDVAGLQSALNGKSNVGHTHTHAEISGTKAAAHGGGPATGVSTANPNGIFCGVGVEFTPQFGGRFLVLWSAEIHNTEPSTTHINPRWGTGVKPLQMVFDGTGTSIGASTRPVHTPTVGDRRRAGGHAIVNGIQGQPSWVDLVITPTNGTVTLDDYEITITEL